MGVISRKTYYKNRKLQIKEQFTANLSQEKYLERSIKETDIKITDVGFGVDELKVKTWEK